MEAIAKPPGARKLWMNQAGEAGLAIAITLVFFGGFFSLLEIFFPTGAGIRQLLSSDSVSEGQAAAGTERRMYADGLSLDSVVGRLSARKNDVRAKATDTVVWTTADLGMELRHRESIQTLDNAAATITLSGNDAIDLGPNTLIVLKDLEEDIFSQRRRSSLLVMGGALRGRLSSSGHERVSLEVPAGDGTATIRPMADEGGEVVFRVDVQEDKTATVTVEKGQAEVQAGDAILTVAENEATHLKDPKLPPSLIRLGRGPTLLMPLSGQRFQYRGREPEVALAWTRVTGIPTYHLEVARDDRFAEIIYDQRIAGTGVVLPRLAAGTYFWSVIGEADGSVRTTRSENSFQVIRDAKPPELRVDLPEGNVTQATIVVEGKVEPGSTVRVAGERVRVDGSGRFSKEVALMPGPNVIVVEAIDPAGNVVYKSSVINRKRSR